MWAKTAKELKEEEEQDIDNLIEFAYDLDYEKYMEDLEVRQALALIKDRVDELKQDLEWKEKAERDYQREIQIQKIRQEWKDEDAKSTLSKTSNKSMREEVID